jgi:phosphohistidine phosphatase
MSLYLVQHGEAYTETINPDRPLTEKGKTAVERMAKLAAELKVPVSRICQSGKTRAKQTAEIFSKHLRPSTGIIEIKGINPYDDVTKIAPALDPSKNTMLVGHLPFMGRLASYLIIGEMDKIIIKFKQGGIVCLDQDDANGTWWYIKWALVPEMA